MMASEVQQIDAQATATPDAVQTDMRRIDGSPAEDTKLYQFHSGGVVVDGIWMIASGDPISTQHAKVRRSNGAKETVILP